MKHSVQVSTGIAMVLAVAGTSLMFGCDGSSSGTPTPIGNGGKAVLQRLEYGRVVDVYAYRRVDSARPDRRDVMNRAAILVASNVPVSPNVQSEQLFDSAGQENTSANYRFLPFDVSVGHEELLILWDDTNTDESGRFSAALGSAKQDLVEIPPSFRSQNTVQRPIPVLPRNAAIVMTFDRSLGLDTNFFESNPQALQLLEFKANPQTTPAQLAYRPVSKRVIADGDRLIIDTTLIGGETSGGQTSTGLPVSPNNVSANLRLAIPTSGPVSNLIRVEPDPVTELNGPDMNGDNAVIRDFRSGNEQDGSLAALADFEPPSIVTDVDMGITAIDTVNKIVTMNKRSAQIAVRGRIPFVDGGIVSTSIQSRSPDGLPGGPPQVPTLRALRSGDIIRQDVITASGERVTIRAEVIQNLGVGNIVGEAGFPSLGLSSSANPLDPEGATEPTVRVRVASLSVLDSQGNTVPLQAEPLNPAGADCSVRVHYYHHVPYLPAFEPQSGPLAGPIVVTDSGRLGEFVVFEPETPRLSSSVPPVPIARGEQIAPDATVSLRFSEPMDLLSVNAFNNFVLTNNFLRDTGTSVGQQLTEDKPSTLSVLASRLIDAESDGTLLTLKLPMGHFHDNNAGAPVAEPYWFHLLIDTGNPDDIAADLAGNTVEIFDMNLATPADALSFRYTMDPAAADNLVGSRVLRFESIDEDGTRPGSVDFFGQFNVRDGALQAAPTTRFSAVADDQTLPSVDRGDKGECWDPVTATSFPSPLYGCISNILFTFFPPSQWYPPTIPLPFGGITEPHNPRGSRLQMTYREDDFGLSHTDPLALMIDVEQLHWASWRATPVQFDIFDRITIAAAHADYRPDQRNVPQVPPPSPPTCMFDSRSCISGLVATFSQNVLEGSQPQTVVADAIYQIDPNALFTAETGNRFVPYAKFERTYTWRDSRLVTWDMAAGRAVGLSGAKIPQAPANADATANVSSPWIGEGVWGTNPPEWGMPVGFLGTTWNQAEGDFHGDRVRDHDPIAMPLLLDFKVWPDDPQNGVALGVNEFWIAYVGPPGGMAGCWVDPPPGSPANGYYSQGGLFPNFRVHSSGGVAGGSSEGTEVFLDPGNEAVARGGWIKDPGLGDPTFGRFLAPFGDDHLHWGQIDFVRKVSMATFGFFDTQQPNRHDLVGSGFVSGWPGLTEPGGAEGFPDFDALGTARAVNYRIKDLLTIVDPPLALLPPGTSTRIEFRGAAGFQRSARMYRRLEEDRSTVRGNLLNPNYACEAYRYSSPNSGVAFDTPRVASLGMTPYVTEAELNTIRDVRGLLPQFMNFRVISRNNTSVTPAIAVSIDGIGLVYRMSPE